MNSEPQTVAGCHTPSTTSARGDWAVTSPSSRGLGAPGVCAFARLRCPAQVRPSGGPAPASSWAGPHPPRRRRTPWVLGPAEYRGWVLRPLQNSRNSPSSIHSPPQPLPGSSGWGEPGVTLAPHVCTSSSSRVRGSAPSACLPTGTCRVSGPGALDGAPGRRDPGAAGSPSRHPNIQGESGQHCSQHILSKVF